MLSRSHVGYPIEGGILRKYINFHLRAPFSSTFI